MKIFVTFIFFCVVLAGLSQQPYWQQEVNYKIDVSLHDSTNTLDAFETITYINHSPDTLNFIWFHIWPNAYKNDSTAYSRQLLRNNIRTFYFSGEQQRGYISNLGFKVNNIAAATEASGNIDIIKLILNEPLLPGKAAIITTPFNEKLPYNFSRGGYVGQTYQVTQWYPKPAVYDSKGWHPMPYLDQGEFYSEFGNFEVNITLPENYVVAASGVLQTENELQKLKALGKQPVTEQPNYLLFANNPEATSKREKILYEKLMPASAKQTKTLHYVLDKAHDFAWFASKLFVVEYDTIQLDNKIVDAFVYYHPWNKDVWSKGLNYEKNAVHFYSDKIGTYPYNTVTAVSGSHNDLSDGMEYPGITLITTKDGGEGLDLTIAHEVGHNWFYGALGSNERDHAWMDEGINSFYEDRYDEEKYYNGNALSASATRFQREPPIETTSDDFTTSGYVKIVYIKASLWVKQLQQYLGKDEFDKCMQYYYQQWQFKHPYPNDFKIAIEQKSGRSIEPLYKELFQTGSLDPLTKNVAR